MQVRGRLDASIAPALLDTPAGRTLPRLRPWSVSAAIFASAKSPKALWPPSIPPDRGAAVFLRRYTTLRAIKVIVASKPPMNARCMTQPGTDMFVSVSTAAKMGHPGKRSN